MAALVGRLAGSRSAPGPLSNLAVLLADPGFVLKPDFDLRRLAQAFEMGLQRPREVFLNASTIRSSCRMARPCAHVHKPSFLRSFPTLRG
jgi:hypothetical protein